MSTNSEGLDQSERLREALLDLERANTKEREIRLETEALLKGLHSLASFEDKGQTLKSLLEVFRDIINFENAFILMLNKDELQVAISTSEQLQNGAWGSLSKLVGEMAASGRPHAYFDISMVPHWAQQKSAVRRGICSALYVPFGNKSEPAILICTHSQRGFFGEKHIRISGRFAPLAQQAMKNLRHTLNLEKMIQKLRQEILQRQKAERLAAERQLQVFHSSKMAALGEMAGGIAHEINNPLAIIKGKLGLLKKHIETRSIDWKFVEEKLNKIDATVNRIAKIINGLRFFSRDADADPMECVKVSQIIDDTLELCKERFKIHSIDLRVKCNITTALECRPTQIAQIIMNLLSNAHDAVENLGEKWVTLEVKEQGPSILLSVTDSGAGIQPDIAEKIMQPFFTTKEVGKGTGLGLSIAKGIAEEHHGSLRYDATSENTRFILELPVKQAVASTVTARKAA